MTRFRILALITVTLPIVAGHARPAADLTVTTSVNEPALKLGHDVLTRPFGAQLVDRLAIDGRYAAGPTRLFLVRGAAAGDCPSRYVVVAVRAGTAPAVSAPFGTCSTGASARVTKGRLVISVAAPQPGAPPVRYLYEAGTVKPLDAAYALDDAPALSCRSLREGTDPVDVTLLLGRSLPDEYRRSSSIRRAEIAPDTLREVVTDLACLAMLPNGDKVVPRSAAPLFASKRYGEASYTALDDVARTPATGPDLRAAVRAFSAQMHYYVGRRTSL